MRLSGFVIASALTTLLLGQEASFPLDLILQGGAVAVLGYICVHLLIKTLPKTTDDFRATIKDLSDRHDEWEKLRHDDEKLRHEDSQKLREVMTEMRVHCARVHDLAEKRETKQP